MKNLARISAIAFVTAALAAVFTLSSVPAPQAASQGSSARKPAKVAKPPLQTATLAAGCFWSMEAIYTQMKGVRSAEPGYAGGSTKNPTYEQVCTGATGHAETVNVIFDPKVVSYRDLLRVQMTVCDPTTLNRQGPDEGTQYRMAVFYRNKGQKADAEAVIRELTAKKVWPNKIVTEVKPYGHFYRAEEYHLNYYNLHPNEPYCRYTVAPKIAHFRELFPRNLK